MPSLAERASGELRGIAIVDAFVASKPPQYRTELVEALSLPRSVCSLVRIRQELTIDGAPENLTEDTLRRWWNRQPEHRQETT